MTEQPKKGMSVRMFLAILVGISVVMAVITINFRNKVEAYQQEKLLNQGQEEPQPDDSGLSQP